MKLVLKLSGKVLEQDSLRHSLGRQIESLTRQGHRILLIHGAGKQLSEFCQRAGIPVIQIQGRRVTDAATLDAAKKVFGGVNTDLTVSLLASGVRAVGVSAFDGGLTTSRRRPPLSLTIDGQAQTVDFGYVGEITAIDPRLIDALWLAGFVPVVSCLCRTPEGQVLNINADTLATELSLALRADRLVAVSDVDGIYLDPSDPETRLPDLALEEARRFLEDGVFLDGMIPKVQNAIRLLEEGVEAFQVLSGLQEGALARCLEAETGTLVHR
ncbi:MAG: acetylglutamate kinase [Acidobacteriota bacterium]